MRKYNLILLLKVTDFNQKFQVSILPIHEIYQPTRVHLLSYKILKNFFVLKQISLSILLAVSIDGVPSAKVE